jgi:GNAT superfamily N-acetyltransferase
VIRHAQPGEADALTDIAVRSKAHWGYGADFMAAAAGELIVHEADLERLVVLVAEREHAPVAFASLDLDADEPALVDLWAAPEVIGMGYGRALLASACAVARRRGVQWLRVVSDPNAEGFYVSQGGERVGEQRVASTGRVLPVLRIPTARRPPDPA